jgi:SAM-dependent methyltransferase
MSLKSDYAFADAETGRERQRLLAMQGEFDPDTFRRLEQLGVGPGWSCLEVGCGAGSLLSWLAERAGATGRVVGLDLNPQMAAAAGTENVELRQGDVTTVDLGARIFDLVHARFVFIHVRQREVALANVLRMLRPGGWLLLEEPDFGPAGPASASGEPDDVIADVYEATRQMYLAGGGDPFLGRRLVGWLQGHGLVIMGAEATASLWQGGSSRARLRRDTAEPVGPRLVATGAITAEQLTRFARLADDPAVWAFDYTTVAAWGKRAGP